MNKFRTINNSYNASIFDVDMKSDPKNDKIKSPVAEYAQSPIKTTSSFFKGSQMPEIKNIITDRYSFREAMMAKTVM